MGLFSDTVIVTDLDGTYYGNYSDIVPRNTEALLWYEEQGGFFTLATGRMAPNLAHDLKEGVSLVNAPVSSCNGSCLYDLSRNKILAEKPMDRAVTWPLIKYVDEHYPDIGVRISVPDGFLTRRETIEKNPRVAREYEHLANAAGHIEPQSEWDGFTWYKLVFRSEPDVLERLRGELMPLFSDSLTISNSGASFLEVQRKGVSKASLLPEVRQYCSGLSGKRMRLVCCGDYENDCDMLRAADLSVCPENAIPAVKEIADLCLCHHTKGLMADTVEYLAAEKGVSVSF